ncbi:hypothetical protein BVX95_01530, partial [archaeon D22]
MREFDKVLNEGEKVLWEGKPVAKPYIFEIPILIMTAFLSLFTLGGLLLFFKDFPKTENMGIGGILFFVGFMVLFITFLYRYLEYSKLHYAITDKRVLIQKGIIGRDFAIYALDRIPNAEMNVSMTDK